MLLCILEKALTLTLSHPMGEGTAIGRLLTGERLPGKLRADVLRLTAGRFCLSHRLGKDRGEGPISPDDYTFTPHNASPPSGRPWPLLGCNPRPSLPSPGSAGRFSGCPRSPAVSPSRNPSSSGPVP